MTWTPALTTLNTRAVASNVLTYVADAARQGDAYAWAGNSSLKLIKTIANSVASRTTPFYPSIAFSDDNDIQNFEDDLIVAAYSFILEISIQNANPDTAVTQARTYAKAIVSMIRNCPLATFAASTGADTAATVIDTIEVGFEQIKTNEMQNDFLQQFQVRTTCRLSKAAYT